MKNTIARRIFDFLKAFPPFSFIDSEELLEVSASVVVRYCEASEIIFKQGDRPLDYFFVVREGAVHLFRERDSNQILIDKCDEGDIFGLRPLIASHPYALTASVQEEALVYSIPTASFSKILQANPKVNHFLASSFAAGERNPFAKQNKGKIFSGGGNIWDMESSLVEIQSIENSKKPVCCFAHTSIKEAARIMGEAQVGSIIIINEQYHPVGIVTDKDFRNQVATGIIPLDTRIEAIMSSPVITVPPALSVADVQIEMIKHHIHHLCITKDGSVDSEVIGVLSEHDLLVIQGNNPAVLIRETLRAKDGKELSYIRVKAEQLLQKYLHQDVAISYISDIMTEINDAIIVRAINRAKVEMEAAGKGAPPVSFCWLAFGSEGRSEQLLRTDQDNALIFENVEKEDYKGVKDYFLDLAQKVTGILHECGFEYCPADMMASNPRWCLSLKEWKKQFEKWIFSPGTKEVMHSTIFFDYRPVFGDNVLADSLTKAIYDYIDRQEIFLSFLAKNALQNPPPLSFFRNFIVENDGEHKNEFDIKARAMMPLADAARVLILSAKVTSINNTFQRFDHMAKLEPAKKELFEQAADAYEILMRYRTLQGLKHKDSGRYFKPDELNKMQRLMLRNSFRPIKELQSILSVRFQLNLLS